MTTTGPLATRGRGKKRRGFVVRARLLRCGVLSRRLSVLGGVLVLIVLSGASPVAADVVVEYEVRAAADGVRVGVAVENFAVIEQLVDAGVPSAQAQASSSNGNIGFSGNPYPGDTVVTAHDLVAGAIQGRTGQDVDVPPYPLHASSRHPNTPESKVEQPGYSLSSRSDESSSESNASAGVSADPGAVGRVMASAESAADLATGAARALAESDVQGMTINDVLQLGRVHSTATVTSRPDGTVTRSSDLSIGDTRVAGQRVAITPNGIEAVGNTVGLPSSDQVTETLKQAGVSVRYLAEEMGKEGVVSAGIEVTAVRKDPTGGSNQTLVVTYVFGRASASAGGSAEELPMLAPVVTKHAAGGELQRSAVSPVSADAAVPARTPDAPQESSPVPAAAPPPELAGQAPEQRAARLLAWPGDLGGIGVYLMLVLGASAVFVGGTLVRLLGVRTRWTP